MPTVLPRLRADAAFRMVSLPLHLNWSDPGRTVDLRDRRQRARLCERVIRDGTAGDVVAYIDGVLLADLWPELVLPVAVRRAWEAALPVLLAGSGGAAVSDLSLTALQVEVACVFFALQETEGFLLAGGTALVASELTDRPTQDLDMFCQPPAASRQPPAASVIAARDALVAAAHMREWTTTVRETESFCRPIVHIPASCPNFLGTSPRGLLT